MTRFAAIASTKIAKITAKTIPVALLLTRSPRKTKSEDEVLFYIGITCDISRRTGDTGQKGKGEKTLSVWEKLTMDVTPQTVLVGMKFFKAEC